MRIDGTRSLIAAARAAGARRFIAQSISFMCSPFGSGLTDEETPLYLDAPPAVRALAEAIASLERQTLEANGMTGAATVKVLAHEARGIYNIVDDSPVRLSEWLPVAAKLLGAPAPGREDEASARKRIGDLRVYYMDQQRGASNAKAKRALEWQPDFTSWQAGFEALYSNRSTTSPDVAR